MSRRVDPFCVNSVTAAFLPDTKQFYMWCEGELEASPIHPPDADSFSHKIGETKAFWWIL